MIFFADTHKGLVRPDNQDCFLVREIASETFLAAVADGMGGHPAGDRAARMAMDMVENFRPGTEPVTDQLHRLVIAINEAILAAGAADPDLENMGTTLTLALIQGDTAHWVHVGDSRLYHFDGNDLRQMTVDQNMAQGMLERGELTPEEARVAPFRNLLDQYVGFPDIEPVAGSFAVGPGDRLLLCTDGLHGEIPANIIAEILMAKLPPADLIEIMFAAALSVGAHDNITAALLEIAA